MDKPLDLYMNLVKTAAARSRDRDGNPAQGKSKKHPHPNWGGKRQGSGRKKGSVFVAPENRRIPVQIRLPQFKVDWMLTQNKSIAKTIEYAVTLLMENNDVK